ncbi:MAG: hypothetical protein U0167_02300 [bacterium]
MKRARLATLAALSALVAAAALAGPSADSAPSPPDSTKVAGSPPAAPSTTPSSAGPSSATAASTGPFRVRIGSRLYPDWSEERVIGLDEPFYLGDTDLRATAKRHLQDFKIKNGVVYEASKEPNNPALFIVVTRDTSIVDSTWAFRNFPPHASPTSFFTFQLLDLADSSKATSRAAPSGSGAGKAKAKHPHAVADSAKAKKGEGS